MPRDTAPQVSFDVAREDLTGRAGPAFVARLIRFLDPGDLLRRKVRVKRRRLGEFLARMSDKPLAGLRECARLVSRRLVPQVARHSLRPLIRHCVRTVGRVVRSGRRWVAAGVGAAVGAGVGAGVRCGCSEASGACRERGGRRHAGNRSWTGCVSLVIVWELSV